MRFVYLALKPADTGAHPQTRMSGGKTEFNIIG